MEESILTSTKKVLNVPEAYTAFDLDIIMHINAAIGVLTDIGIGPSDGLAIEDASTVWSVFDLSANMTSLVKAFIFQKTRLMFDPPSTSFHLEALKQQIDEFVFRLSVNRENRLAEAEGA